MFGATRLAASLSVVVLLAASAIGADQQPWQVMPRQIERATVILAAERLMVDRTYPPRPASETRNAIGMPVDLRILQEASRSADPIIRREFVLALGRLEEPTDVDTLFPFLNDRDARVRLAALEAIPQALLSATPEKNGPEIARAYEILQGWSTRALFDPDSPSAYALAQAIGELPLDELLANDAARRFSAGINRLPVDQRALVGLAALSRHRHVRLSEATLKRLRYLAVLPQHTKPDPLDAQFPALEILSSLRDDDAPTILKAAAYRPLRPCVKPVPDCGWEFRRLGVLMLNAADPKFEMALREASRDMSPHVRFAAVQVHARAIGETKTCGPLIDAMSDRMPHVVLQAIDGLDPRCEEREDVTQRLLSWVNELSDTSFSNSWQPRARALEALAKFSPDEAKTIANESAASHELWQVRATAARVAGILKDEALAERLAKDKEANVRTEALDALALMQSVSRVQVAEAALASDDYMLVLTGAMRLNRAALGPVLAQLFAATAQKQLMDALKRLTDDDNDGSRDPRVEILARLGEYGDPNDYEFKAALEKYLTDVDPVVATAAADALGRLTGTRPLPQPTKRQIKQPNEAELMAKLTAPPGRVKTARLTMTDGSIIEIALDTENAPLTVYRFRELADAGYYNGLTIHRVVSGLLAQGGSRGANNYSGTTRFWRDEIGQPHDAGAVALLNRGRHTGDGQFFIDLIDIPPFDRRYTVFGRTPVEQRCPTMRILEGAVIANVTVFPSRLMFNPCQ